MSRVQVELRPIESVFLPFDCLTLSLLEGMPPFPSSEDFFIGFLPKNIYTGYFLEYGTWCAAEQSGDGGIKIQGRFRFRFIKIIKDDIHSVEALIDIKDKEEFILFPELSKGSLFNKKVNEKCLEIMDKLRRQLPDFPVNKDFDLMKVGDLAFYLGHFLPITFFEARGDIIRTSNPIVRLDKAAAYLKIFTNNKAVSIPIRLSGEKGKGKMEEREDVKNFRKKLADLAGKISSEASVVIKKRIDTFSKINTSSAAYQYIYDWLSFALNFYSLEKTADNDDIKDVWKILDADHYGLTGVKERIIEEIAVRKLNPDKKGPILGFVGSPGVGKTSLGRSIARALGRKFVRMSLGGVKDEATIRGHSMTYVGAKSGRILENILRSGSSNPVIMLDEIDKLGQESLRGNVESALLEVLDPEQNFAFTDHYLDLPADLSGVIFIITANTDDNIPGALCDRMEIINFSSYTFEEKLGIAKDFLIPRQIERNGLAGTTVADKLPLLFTEELLVDIINFYTFEAGVRNFERNIAAILRKIAKSYCFDFSDVCEIRPDNLRNFLGPRLPTGLLPKIEPTPAGVAWGVTVNSFGGMLLRVEAVIENKGGYGDLELTGNLGEEIKETAQDAFKYFRSRIRTHKKGKVTNDVHIKVGSVGVSKDGPSGGLAIACALYSCYKKLPVKLGVVMTGEINLSGEVSAVGGIPEKIMAAEKAGAKDFIMPKANQDNLLDVSEKVRNKIRIHLVSTIADALRIAFGRKKRKKKI